jgi:hypothetical protein
MNNKLLLIRERRFLSQLGKAVQPLWLSCYLGLIDKSIFYIDLLLKHKKHLHKRIFDTALIQAIRCPNEQPKIVDYLCKNTIANVNFRYRNKNNFLHSIAKRNDHTKLLKVLLDNGCDYNAKNKWGKSPVDLFNDENRKAFNQWLNIKYEKPEQKQKQIIKTTKTFF